MDANYLIILYIVIGCIVSVLAGVYRNNYINNDYVDWDGYLVMAAFWPATVIVGILLLIGSILKWIDEEWYWVDTGENINTKRKCPKCQEVPTVNGHDPCIANLPGVEYACCGHGLEKPSIILKDKKDRLFTVKFENTSSLLHFINVGAVNPKTIKKKYPDIPKSMIKSIAHEYKMKKLHDEIISQDKE